MPRIGLFSHGRSNSSSSGRETVLGTEEKRSHNGFGWHNPAAEVSRNALIALVLLLDQAKHQLGGFQIARRPTSGTGQEPSFWCKIYGSSWVFADKSLPPSPKTTMRKRRHTVSTSIVMNFKWIYIRVQISVFCLYIYYTGCDRIVIGLVEGKIYMKPWCVPSFYHQISGFRDFFHKTNPIWENYNISLTWIKAAVRSL